MILPNVTTAQERQEQDREALTALDRFMGYVLKFGLIAVFYGFGWIQAIVWCGRTFGWSDDLTVDNLMFFGGLMMIPVLTYYTLKFLAWLTRPQVIVRTTRGSGQLQAEVNLARQSMGRA